MINENTLFYKNLIKEFLDIKKDKEIEIEVRLGIIKHKLTLDRIKYKVDHPIVFKELPCEMEFEALISKEHFLEYKKKIKSNLNIKKRKETHDIITLHKNGRKIENEEKTRYEKKIRIKSLTIYLPKEPYDLRLSISKEKEEKSIINSAIKFKRERFRESLFFNEYVLDFTKVKKDTDEEKIYYELEMEVLNQNYKKEDFIEFMFELPKLK